MPCAVAGYEDEVAQEQLARNLVYLDCPETVLGELVRNITPHLLAVLTAIQSPFITGGPIRYPHIAQFIWALHRDYSPNSWWKRYLLTNRLNAFSLEESVRGINAFLDLTFMDAPQSGKDEKPIAANVAWLIYRFRQEPWRMTEEQTKHTPLRKLYQELRCFERENGEIPQNKSDKKIAEWLQRIQKWIDEDPKEHQKELDAWNARHRRN